MTSEETDSEKTLRLMRQLRVLLEDPHPGLFSWIDLRGRAAVGLRDHLNALLVPKGKTDADRK